MSEATRTPEQAIEEWKELQQLQKNTEKEFDDQMAPLIEAHEQKLAPIKTAREEKLAPIDAKLEELETWFIKQSETDGTDEYKSDAGEVTISTRDKPSIEDSEKFYEWVETTKNSELLQKRLSVTKFRTFVKENNGEIPPGVSVETERSVKFKET